MTAPLGSALLFDLDETLVGLRPGAPGLEALRYDLLSVYQAHDLVPAHRSIFRMYAELSDLGHRDVAHRTIDRHEVRWAEESAVSLIDAGTVATLTALRGSTALVTNNGRGCVDVLMRRGLLPDVFDVVVARDDVERLKPDPEPVLRAICAVAGSGERPTVFFGDSVSDREAAKAARSATTAPLAFVHVDASRGVVVSTALLDQALTPTFPNTPKDFA